MSFDADGKFERALLESARGDAAPRDVPEAWARFAASLASAAPGVDGGRAHGAGDAIPRASAAAAARGARVGAVKWLLLGVLGGAAPTVALVLGHRPVAPVAPPVAVAAAPPSLGAHPEPSLAPPPLPSGATPAPDAPRAPSDAARASTPSHRRAAPAGASVRLCRAGDERAPATDAPRSTLSAEVSRIDTARTASALGDYDEAVRLLDRYHRDFPGGALGPDADVVAIEAAAAKRDQPEVERRAALFLARYPNDPQAARVRALVAGPAPRSPGEAHQ
jgi:hypothetical protein